MNEMSDEMSDKQFSILIVDDSLFLRKRLRQVLQPEGYTLTEAVNGVSALDAIDKQEFACILTDLVMPVMDGFGLLSELQKRHSHIPAVVLTADIQKTTRDRCEELGAAAFLQKPINADELRSVVSRILTAEKLCT